MSPDLINEFFSWPPVVKLALFAVIVAAIYVLVYRLPVAVIRRHSFRCPHCNAHCSEHASSCPRCGGNLGSGTSSEAGDAIRQPYQGQQRGVPSARTVLATLGGVLIGPFAGCFITWLLCSIVGSRSSCMWKFEALGWSFFLGAPIGLITFGVIGFWAGKRLDKTARVKPSEEGSLRGGEPKIECPECGAVSGGKTHFGCIVNDADWIATCGACGHRWGPGMEKYSNLLP